MHPVSHFLSGWLVANTVPLTRRERIAVTFASVIPDIDGFGAPFEALTRNSDSPLRWYTEYHHVLAHNIFFGVAVTAGCFLLAGGAPDPARSTIQNPGSGTAPGPKAASLRRRRLLLALLGAAAFHLHLFLDLLGSRGPDGSQWPVPYLWPLNTEWSLTWSGQWELNAWPNFAITGAMLAVAAFLAVRRGFSPVDIFSPKLDRKVVDTLRKRLGQKR
jgi:inner membrane protein